MLAYSLSPRTWPAQEYGVQHWFTLEALTSVGLLRCHKTNAWFSRIRMLWFLVSKNTDETTTTDASFAFNGFIPLSMKIVEQFTGEDVRTHNTGATKPCALTHLASE